MNVGLYQSASALSALERWQSVVSQNITSSQVAGFKKRTIEFETELMGEVESAQKTNGRNEMQPAYFPRTRFGINYTGGEVTPTGRDLDAAIQGEGFFVLRGPNGQQLYTRSGELAMRSDRTIIHSSGTEILAEGGVPLQGLPTGGKLVINSDGTVFQGDVQLGKLQVVKFQNMAGLFPAGNSGFVAPGQDPIPVEAPEVIQGYLEGSNVSPMREMIDLVKIARAYEANQKIITTRDNALEKALEKLG